MVNKKNWLGMLAIMLVFGMTVVGCTTTMPILYTDNPNKEFTILGEVTHKIRAPIGYGYNDLLNAAKSKYPDTDYVIDIMIDYKKTLMGEFYIMRATAIRYNR
jgi:hypothetical protein